MSVSKAPRINPRLSLGQLLSANPLVMWVRYVTRHKYGTPSVSHTTDYDLMLYGRSKPMMVLKYKSFALKFLQCL